MTDFVNAAFGERELLLTEFDGLTNLLRDDDIPEYHRIGVNIRLKLIRWSIKQVDDMISGAIDEMDFDLVMNQINHNLSIKKN